MNCPNCFSSDVYKTADPKLVDDSPPCRYHFQCVKCGHEEVGNAGAQRFGDVPRPLGFVPFKIVENLCRAALDRCANLLHTRRHEDAARLGLQRFHLATLPRDKRHYMPLYREAQAFLASFPYQEPRRTKKVCLYCGGSMVNARSSDFCSVLCGQLDSREGTLQTLFL